MQTKAISVLFFSCVASLLAVSCGSMPAASTLTPTEQSIPERPDKLGLEEVKFELPKPERFELSNGLLVLYRFDDEVPLMSGTIFLRGGKLWEDPELPGSALALGSQIREGSFEGMDPRALDTKLDSLGASIETSFGDEFGSAAFSCLSEDFREVLGLVSNLIQRPAFDPDRLNLWKVLVSDLIRRRRDDPGTMASMTFADLIYGENSAYGRNSSLESVQRIIREDLQRLHKRFVSPRGAVLALTGSLPLEEVKRMLESDLASWKAEGPKLPPIPSATDGAQPGVYVLERDFDQTTIIMGHLGPPRLSPDHFGISIFNRIFGAGEFESTLFSEVRSKQGLAYVVDGSLNPGPVVGVFQVDLGTKNESALDAVKRVDELIKEAATIAPTVERTERAKISVKRGFVFSFDDPKSIVNRAAYLEILKYPKRFDENYLANISAVTNEAVLRAAKNWVHSDRLVVVMVGRLSPEAVKAKLGDRWPVYRLDFETEAKVLEKLP